MSRLRILIARARSQNVSRLATSFIVEEVSNMTSLIEAMVNRTPEVLLMSVDFPGLGGPPGVREIRKLNSSTRIIVLTSKVDEHEELEVLRAGARGYCGPLETEGLLKMIEKVQQGEVWAGRRTIGALLDEFFGEPPETLSPTEQTLTRSQIDSLTFREREILRLLGEGASNKEIAAALNVAVSTIKAHLTKIFRKLGQPDRLRLALCAAAVRRDLV